jgi:hypothetical protein
MQWARLLAYVTGLINQELLLQNEYLAAENRILRAHLPIRLRLPDPSDLRLLRAGGADQPLDGFSVVLKGFRAETGSRGTC